MLLASLFVLFPVWHFSRKGEQQNLAKGQQENIALNRRQANIQIFKERLSELETERENGALAEQQYEQLKQELERSLIGDVEGDHAELKQALRHEAVDISGSRSLTRIPIVLALLLPAISYMLYAYWGNSAELELAELLQAPAQKSGQQQHSEGTSRREIEDLSVSLKKFLVKNSDSGEAWYYLARNQMTLQQYQQAGEAFSQAAKQLQQGLDKAGLLGQAAQAMYFASGRRITAAVKQTIEQAQALDPKEDTVLGLLGMDAYSRQQYAEAIEYWQRLLSLVPQGHDSTTLRKGIARAEQMLATSSLNPQKEQPGKDLSTEKVTEKAAGVKVLVQLHESIVGQLAPDTRVFVFARSEKMPMPLAATRLTVKDLPALVELNDAMAMMPQLKLSSVEAAYVVARVSQSGQPIAQPGDYQAQSKLFTVKQQREVVSLLIKDVVL